MICTECKARFGSHYNKCPSCGSKQIEQEQRIPLHDPEPDLTIPIEQLGILVEFTELDDFGAN